MTIVVVLFIRSVIRKSYQIDIKYHMTLNAIFSVMSFEWLINFEHIV